MKLGILGLSLPLHEVLLSFMIPYIVHDNEKENEIQSSAILH